MTPTLLRRAVAPLLATTVLAVGLMAASPAQAATVTATATTRATLRTAAAGNAPVLATLERGQALPTTAGAKGGWVPVRFAKGTAYVAAGQLDLTGTARLAAPTRITKGTKITTVTVNVRTGASTGHAVVGRVSAGATISATGKTSRGFAQVSYAKHLRWVSSRYLAQPARPTGARAAAAALAYAKLQLGKPYRYGAAGPAAFDCSGLTSAAWKAAGVTLPRTSAQQFGVGRKVAKADLQPGDLVFFYGATPGHVALYAGHGLVIHAPRPGKTVEYLKMEYMPFSGARRVA